jgi:GNAT superfamily N-acetyltransferase
MRRYCTPRLSSYDSIVILDYSRLTLDRCPQALAMMQRFYAEESLEYREERARPALEGIIARPELGGWWFILADGEAVGYFVLTACYSLEFGGRFALLDEFYVVPDRRGAGIGALVLDRVQEEAARMGVSAIRLEVDRLNPRVRGFYARSGFAAHDRDLMTKWLPAVS